MQIEQNDSNNEKINNSKLLPAVAPAEREHEGIVLSEMDLLKRYLKEIAKYPLLTREEEDRLTKLYYETKDPAVASQIVTANLRLVVKIALDFQKAWMQNFLDLVQEGSYGLIQAVKKFDPYKGVKFSYYASFWIKAYILKFIMDNWRLVKIGTTQAQRKLFYNLHKEKNRLQALGFEPVPKLISERLEVSEKDVVDMEQRMGSWEVSFDAPITGDSEDTQLAFLPSPEPLPDAAISQMEISEQLNKYLQEFLNSLDEKERFIFENRLLAEESSTLQEIGEKFGVSRERIRQIETKLKKRFKAFLEERIPDIATYGDVFERN